MDRRSNGPVARTGRPNVRREYSQTGIVASEGNGKPLVRRPRNVLETGELDGAGGGVLDAPRRDPSIVGSGREGEAKENDNLPFSSFSALGGVFLRSFWTLQRGVSWKGVCQVRGG